PKLKAHTGLFLPRPLVPWNRVLVLRPWHPTPFPVRKRSNEYDSAVLAAQPSPAAPPLKDDPRRDLRTCPAAKRTAQVQVPYRNRDSAGRSRSSPIRRAIAIAEVKDADSLAASKPPRSSRSK